MTEEATLKKSSKADEMAKNSSTKPKIVLKVEKLDRDFSLGKITVRALKTISFEIYKGQFVSIMGKSGSGKTTLLNILGTLDTPTSGEVFIDGSPISKMKDAQRTAIRRERIGFVFQNYNLIPVLNAVENVELPLFNSKLTKQQRREKALDMLDLVGLKDRADHKPEEMSGGQCQRVSIARALIANPAIILGDEPTGALDSKTGEAIIQLFEKLNREKGYTIILVTHDDAIGGRADRKIVLKDGMITSDTTSN
jgi:putative ABC transport system ATP-binding protein